MAKILLVDDDLASREILRFRLQKAGHEILEASNGEEGLAAALNARPDLVFLDVLLPNLDGWEVCRMIKRNPETKHIFVIMLTGCDQNIDELRGWECGADDYVVKPWTSEVILKLIDKLIPAPRAA